MYVIEDQEALFKKLRSIPDPSPVNYPLTGEKVIRHLSRLKQVNDISQVKFPPGRKPVEVKATGVDPEQSRAAEHYLGPLLCIAPAGSGKTTTLITRVTLLVQRGVEPRRILCLTFTKKAQLEMQERLVAKLGDKARKITVRTYHALAYMLMTEFTGRTPDIILDRFSILRNMDTGCKLEDLDSHISLNLNSLVLPHEIKPLNKKEKQLLEGYRQYLDYLNKNRVTDQDFLLVQLCETLRGPKGKQLMDFTYPGDPPGYPKGRWHFVFIDEAQDNNLAQDVITRFISPWDNTFWVGDEDQLLYSFRGSNIQRILNLQEIYPNLKEIHLKRNYRCHPEIVAAADSLIKHNTMRRPKEIVAARQGKGRAVFFESFPSITGEYEWVAGKISRLLQAGVKPEHIAVLYRNNSQGDALSSVSLKRANIPHYVHRNGTPLFESADMDAVLNHLTLLTNKIDAPCCKNAVLGCLRTAQKSEYIGPLVSGGVKTAYMAAKTNNDLKAMRIFLNIGSLRMDMFPDAGTVVAYARRKFSDLDIYCDPDRLDLIEKIAGRFKNIKDFVEWVKKIKLTGDKNSKSEGKVQLMTVHASKGLEFPVVFLVNCTTGHFPSSKALTPEELEEERRIFYVGITRARERLYMSGYNDKDRKISGFVTELHCLVKNSPKKRDTI
ncbi:MAG: ATP-dependent helicase [Peptococcaceae bacterium]|nr:ATP-dependent helicase [Peptococcaceae bacterium]